MSRHSADKLVRLNVYVAHGFEAYWKLMLEQDSLHKSSPPNTGFTINDIHGYTNGVHKNTIRDYLFRLQRAGFLREISTDAEGRKHYELLKTPLRAPRLRRDGSKCTQNAGQAQMWVAMRQLDYFTPGALIIAASTEETPVSLNTAKSYLSHLLAADYLTVLKEAKPGTQAIYRLKRNTGPRPPQIQRTKFVFDPNLGEIMTRKAVSEEVKS